MRCMHVLLLAIALAAAPKTTDKTELIVKVKPETVVIWVDGKKLGTAKKTYTLKVKPGAHQIKVQNNKDTSEETVVVKKGESKTWELDMTDSGATPVPTPGED